MKSRKEYNKLMADSGGFIIIPKCLIILLGINATIFLSEIISLHFKAVEEKTIDNGFIHARQNYIYRQTGLTKFKQREAKSLLKEYGIIDFMYDGLPRQLYYKLDWDELLGCIEETQ